MLNGRLGLSLATAALLASLIAPQASADVLTGYVTADNAFFAYVGTSNATLGTLIGSGNNWSQSFPLTPTTLGPGTYYLQVEAINYGGPGGLIGSFSVGGQNFVTNPTDWQAAFNNYNYDPASPQPWVTPYAATVVTTAHNWGIPGSIDPSAQWIDALAPTVGLNSCSDPMSGQGNCTVDFSYQFTIPSSAPGPTPGAGLAGLSLLLALGAARKLRGAQG